MNLSRLLLGLVGAIVIAAVLAAARPASAAFPGPNGRIAFDNGRSGGTQNIFTVRPDGSDVRQLTFSPPGRAPRSGPPGRLTGKASRSSAGATARTVCSS
jgi:hypothetical protein